MTDKKPTKPTTTEAPKVDKPQQPSQTNPSKTRFFDSANPIQGESGSTILNEKKDK